MKGKIYCISGLGADEKVFSRLRLDEYELVHLPWLHPEKNESIGHYAQRMMSPVEEVSPLLLGVSFGGMMSIEIAKLLPASRVVLVSSIKTKHELPGWMKVAGKLFLDKVVPLRPHRITEKLFNDRLGAFTREEKEMVRHYRGIVDPVYLKWAVHEILNWKNEWQAPHLVHVHGDRDKIFPIRHIHADHVVKEGTHFMVYNRAGEISDILNRELKKISGDQSSSSPSRV